MRIIITSTEVLTIQCKTKLFCLIVNRLISESCTRCWTGSYNSNPDISGIKTWFSNSGAFSLKLLSLLFYATVFVTPHYLLLFCMDFSSTKMMSWFLSSVLMTSNIENSCSAVAPRYVIKTDWSAYKLRIKLHSSEVWTV